MAIDIKNILEIVQRKVANVDASTSTADLQKLLNLAKRVDGSLMRTYDSDGSLPDAGSTTERMAYITSTGVVKFNNGRWDNLTGTALSAGEQGDDTTKYYGYTSAYAMGGVTGAASPYTLTQIDTFPFASDVDATDAGDIGFVRTAAAGASSQTHAYVSGGDPLSGPTAPSPNTNSIEKYSFADGGSTTDVGDLVYGTRNTAGTFNRTDAGYVLGGGPSFFNYIQKFPFADETQTTDAGDLLATIDRTSGHASTTDGYAAGGTPNLTNTIQKWPFSTGGNSTDVGDLTVARGHSNGLSSDTHGYNSGGYNKFGPTSPTPGLVNTIDKFSFATDGNSTAVSTLSSVRQGTDQGASSNVNGYITGGSDIEYLVSPTTNTVYNDILKMPFASEGGYTDVASLAGTRRIHTNGFY